MNFQFAERIKDIGTAQIRQQMEVPADMGMISFASGIPAWDLFPIDDVKNAAYEALVHWENIALQYAPSEGLSDLRKKIALRMNKTFHTKNSAESICVTTGSQQAFDILGKMFLNEGDVVLCESPIPLSVLMAFSKYGIRFVEVASDQMGMMPEDVDAVLRKEKNAKMVYVSPDFSGVQATSWSAERRREVLKAVSDFDIVVVEDITNSELLYEGEIPPALASYDTRGQVVVVGSFSKIFCPGIRVGWIASPQEISLGIQILKRAADLSSSSLDQCVLDSYMEKYDIDAHVRTLVRAYREKRNLLDRAMREEFPKSVIFDKPEGGMYFWVRLNGMRANDLLKKCIAQQVSFVPAEQFFPNGGGENIFRLSFSALPKERIRAGVKRIVRGMTALGSYQSTRVTVNPKQYLNVSDEFKKSWGQDV